MQTGLKPEDAWNQAENYRTDILYWWATEYFIESFSHNSQQYRRKLRLATVGLMVLAVQIGVGIACIGVTFN